MKAQMKYIILGMFMLSIFGSCEKLDERTVFPHSTPVIESATINPSIFVYGDSLTMNIKVSDSETPLSTVEMKMIVNDKIIASGSFRTAGNNADISPKFATKFLSQLPDNAKVEVLLTLINVEDDRTTGSVEGVTARRKQYTKLYLVLEDGRTFDLNSVDGDQYKFASADGLSLPNSIKYLVAEKLTTDNKIDYTGLVWGASGNDIIEAGSEAKYITTTESKKKNTVQVVFDAYSFTTKLVGEELVEVKDLELSMLNNEVKAQNNEIFKEGSFILNNGQKLALKGEFANADVLFNVDYFERIAVDTVKYLGETGPMTLNYNTTRKIVLIQDPNPSYPASLFIAGVGLGYPSKVSNVATIGWGFDNVTQFISFRQIADNIYQGTVYMEGNPDGIKDAGANFKPFLQRGWGGELKSTDFKMPDAIASDTEVGENDGNWRAKKGSATGVYRITIDVDKHVVTAEPFILQ